MRQQPPRLTTKPTPKNISGAGTLMVPAGEENFHNAMGNRKDCKAKGLKPGTKKFRDCLKAERKENRAKAKASGKGKKGKRIFAAILTGGLSEVARAQAKGAAKLGLPMPKKLRNKLLSKAKNKKQLIKGFSVATPVAGKKAGVQIAKSIYTNRLLKNTKAKSTGAPQISMTAPVSVQEQKEAVTAIVYNDPSAMQPMQEAALANPAIAAIMPTPQEANQYAYQQEQMNNYYYELQQQQPQMIQDIQMVDSYPAEEIYEEVIPGEEEIVDEYQDAAEEQVDASNEEGYQGFDSQITLMSLDNDALDIAREGENYFAFDDFFADGDDDDAELQDENANADMEQFLNADDTPEQIAAKAAAKIAKDKAKAEAKTAKAKEKADRKAAKDAQPKTDKGKGVADFFKNLGLGLAANAGNITSSILNKGNVNIDPLFDPNAAAPEPPKKMSMLTIVLIGTGVLVVVVGGVLIYNSQKTA